jgi:REP element-mobilizing transposase RayT
MAEAYQLANQGGAYYVTFQVVDWMDVFSRKMYRDIIIECIKFCRKEKGMELFAYVIMSNHIHLIMRSKHERISDLIRDFKKYTAKNIILEIENSGVESRRDWMLYRMKFNAAQHVRNSKYQFWTHENHAIELLSITFIQQKLNYIHQNPVRAGIVEKPEHYLYSSASNYAGLESLLEIDFV